ncbi:MAG TPA: glycosyltransferase family 1 protein [Acidimicrobiales bacterium]|nr:glycosyltransferase family 1 protein [Acidimicrobiales bacterium]
MRVVVNAVPARGTSLGVVTENLLRGWVGLGLDDELHLVLREGVELDVIDDVQVHRVDGSRLAAMELRVPALCRQLRADVFVGLTPATTMAPLPCPRAIIALDLRHEARPQQFSRGRRLLRGVSYGIGYREADAIVCISQRTRDDLLAAHPYLRTHRVTVAQLGADHVLTWPPAQAGPDYALAFGQWGNKNVDLVLDAWTLLRSGPGPDVLPLVIVGLSAEGRADVEAGAARRGIGDVVTVKPWLSDREFEQEFTSASLVVFPSDYEGFGLPAVEAMRRGIPVVVTPDPALLEVTGGLATVMDGWDAAALARAIPEARCMSERDRQAGIDQASTFTWQRTAGAVRDALVACLR